MNSKRTTAVEVHIEELVLHGFPESSRMSIAAALESQLGQLFTERGFAGAPSAIDVESLRTNSVEVPPNTPADKVGRDLGQAIYRSVSSAAVPSVRADRGPKA
jgi:hypothetical protein